ncbi:hypothetical protein ILUMI_01107 [Ignelater luminosus]|uniref:Uncharacterized protein n=1 Tax=Ignelater luminosus TaxID=2038154 RepID=A0A8K0DFY4_IGNLU|nr:hypothetical protein ILUMI_01107 [Ignelater luminosus]
MTRRRHSETWAKYFSSIDLKSGCCVLRRLPTAPRAPPSGFRASSNTRAAVWPTRKCHLNAQDIELQQIKDRNSKVMRWSLQHYPITGEHSPAKCNQSPTCNHETSPKTPPRFESLVVPLAVRRANLPSYRLYSTSLGHQQDPAADNLAARDADGAPQRRNSTIFHGGKHVFVSGTGSDYMEASRRSRYQEGRRQGPNQAKIIPSDLPPKRIGEDVREALIKLSKTIAYTELQITISCPGGGSVNASQNDARKLLCKRPVFWDVMIEELFLRLDTNKNVSASAVFADNLLLFAEVGDGEVLGQIA